MDNIEMPRWSAQLFRPKRYKVPYGGRGSSKSWTVARALINIALHPELLLFPDAAIRILCAREFQNSITESVHALLSSQIQKMGYSPWFDIRNTYIQSHNGSEFLFKGIRNNVQSIKSMEDVAICWLEEAEKISKHSWQVLIPTIRKDLSEIWATFNPDDEKDETYQRLVVKPPPNAWVEKVNWRQNPWFPKSLKEEMEYLRAVDPEAADHVWEGACNTRSEAVIFRGKYSVAPFIPNAPNTGEWHGPYYGADWGFANDPTVLMKLWININKDAPVGYRNRLMIEKESWGLHIELDDIAPKWVRDIPECIGAVIRADCSRPETISHVSNFPIGGRHHLNVEPALKWSGSVEDGIAYFRSFEQIVIHPSCEHQVDEARLYKYKVDKITQDVLNDIVDKHNHCWDADRYALQPAISTQMEMVLEHQEQVQVSAELDQFDGDTDGFVFSTW